MSHHHHEHDIESPLSFNAKLTKMLEHWLKHNNDHAQTYQRWAEEARHEGLEKIGAAIMEVKQKSEEINAIILEMICSLSSLCPGINDSGRCSMRFIRTRGLGVNTGQVLDLASFSI